MGLELIIDERYRISADKHNYILETLQDVRDKNTQEVVRQDWKDVGYFGDLAHALKRYASETIKQEGKVDISELNNRLKSLESHIERVVDSEKIVLRIKEKDTKSEE